MPSDVIMGILEDQQGFLWVSTNNGIARLNPETGKVHVYDQSNSLPGPQFNTRARLRLQSGNLLFGGTQGFARIDPTKLKFDTTPPLVVFTEFEVLNQPVRPCLPDSLLPQSITETRRLEIPSRTNVISFQFAALDFHSPSRNRYLYQLRGFDTGWREAGPERRASYTNLDPGSYLLQVKASNHDGIWNETGASLELVVLPAWWQSWWFQGTAALALLGAAMIASWTAANRRTQARIQEAERERQLALERQQATEALRESETRYNQLLEHANDGISIVQDGIIRTLNSRFARMAGYQLEEVIGQPLLQFIHPDDCAMVVSRHHERLQGTSDLPSAYEFRLIQKDGKPLGLELNTTLIQWEGERATLNILRDISERKQVGEALKRSEEELRSLFRVAPIGIGLTEHRILKSVNERFCEMTGFTKEEILGQNARILYPTQEDFDYVGEEKYRQIARQGTGTVETRWQRKEGQIINILLSSTPLDIADLARGVIFTALDITDRKRAEEERFKLERQMQQAQKLESLGVLAGGIAHDFNNLLMAILGNADLALGDLPPQSPARQSLRDIEKASRQAAELCRQLLAYSGKGRFVIEPIHLSEMVEEMVHLLKTAISKKAALQLNLQPELPPIHGDPSQIRQIVMNLVINASEAIGEETGTITISTGGEKCPGDCWREGALDEPLPAGEYVWMTISDTGCGMNAETQQRIFEPFFTSKFAGRGLGLSAVLGIVRGHKGALKVHSEPGQGTTFQVLFPAVAEKSPAVRKEEGSADVWRGSGTILLVDDEESVRETGRKMMEKLGFQVLVAADGREALQIFQREAPNISLVVLDLTMPHLNGEETFLALRERDPQVKVVISSGYSETNLTSRFADMGLAGFIQKPYTRAELTSQLRIAFSTPESS
jgi:PAS domain S-box-containing protein